MQAKSKIERLLNLFPQDWLRLTTHRLDIYNEKLAKSEFIEEFKKLQFDITDDASDEILKKQLSMLPTAYDYIRLGHPLSCILEWSVAESIGIGSDSIIAFSSQTMPLFAILRNNLILKRTTQIHFATNISDNKLLKNFDEKLIKSTYGYDFDVVTSPTTEFSGCTVLVTDFNSLFTQKLNDKVYDFVVHIHPDYGSIVKIHSRYCDYIPQIQHVRRRESIAMTPHNCFAVLSDFIGIEITHVKDCVNDCVGESVDVSTLIEKIEDITQTNNSVLFGSCGLSVQYAIMMGLIQYANEKYPEKEIKFIVPPNCYGGTNDQARRVAATLDHVEVLDLPVDSGKDMVEELGKVLDEVAEIDAIPFIIAEIPTNPRVEVPDLERLNATLARERTPKAVKPVFILDQTFCPNVQFLGAGDFLKHSQTIAYVSGSKFPSGGLCTAGYCVANTHAKNFMPYVKKHIELTDNGATNQQLKILVEEMPSMLERINSAYKNTRDFTDFIQKILPEAKLNFVSKELSDVGFTPSVFSLDLPTKGNSPQEREIYKRDLNHKLITLMINEIPEEAKHCVSYGQLKGSYWTIPATSTQGTTKEGDKDYIVRVSIAADFNLKKHISAFKKFCNMYF